MSDNTLAVTVAGLAETIGMLRMEIRRTAALECEVLALRQAVLEMTATRPDAARLAQAVAAAAATEALERLATRIIDHLAG